MSDETEGNNPARKENKKSTVALNEEKILDFWRENKIFEKTLEKDAPKGEFIFYDGPPFATGLPHYGHLLPGTVKDVIPRYKTMRGYSVKRKWGWDCHGLPVENLVEKELGLKSKKDIEDYGIQNFNKKARESIFKYVDDWKEIIPRTGRWVDFNNSYKTLNPQYTESVMWMFKTLYEKKLISEGFKSMHLCPRCETTLSNFEVNLGYKDITDISVTVKFELVDEPGTFVLAWTTTPWTLPGNVALAVNSKIEYVKVGSEGKKYILAKKLLENNFKDKEFEILETFKGDNLLGKSYRPIFNYYAKNEELKNWANGWKIYNADFVDDEDGTGIAHEAPAFGDEDYELLKKENLPFIQHVNKDGTFKDEVSDFKGQQVKPKGNSQNDHQKTDIEIIKFLAGREVLFSKRKIEHSYPHCWRCDTPLLNYASSSWFIEVTKLKNKLISENNKVSWTPESIGKNRFGNWLAESKDWAISRSRFWGAPIPVWRSDDGEEIEIIGSVDDIKEKTKSTNSYFVMRHGEAESNVKGIINSDNGVENKLTTKGAEDVIRSAKILKNKNIDLIITSPLNRTKNTALLIAKELGLSEDKIIEDERIRETNTGEFDNGPISDYRAFFNDQKEKFTKTPKGGENLNDLKKRVGDFIYDIDRNNKNKNILIVTHEYVVWLLDAIKDGLDIDGSVKIKENNDDYASTGEVRPFEFSPIPHNELYELDYHRPYIDEIILEKNGKALRRIPDVFDTWIDSGSMPFASNHYPFEKDKFNPKSGLFGNSTGYPADFIAEGLDQTRGWFYTLLVLNTALFGKAPFKNVVVNGLVLAEDGRKMSKRLGNYPDINDVLDKYGADSLRYFLMSSPAVRAEDVLFSEKGVDEVMKKIVLRLNNVVSFYEMYKDENDSIEVTDSDNVLDTWIVARLNETIHQTTESLEKFELDRASRPALSFVDDLSTWYLRRSRDRFKGNDVQDKTNALRTLRFVLQEISKILAPFMPFISEDIYGMVVRASRLESVHLEKWPEGGNVDKDSLKNMEKTRSVVSLALEARSSAGIKVRQPLGELKIQENLSEKFRELIKDEVNVKSVAVNNSMKEGIELDTALTDALKEEGASRDLIRFIQDWRKKNNLVPEDKVEVTISKEAETFVKKFEKEIKGVSGVSGIQFLDNDGETLKLIDCEVNIIVK